MGVRESLGKITPDAGADYEAAQHVRDAIDNYVETLPPGEIVQGNAQFTQAMLDHARASWRAYAKLDQVHTAMEIGSHRAATAGTGANTQNAMRQRIREILDSDKQSRGFSPETRQQMEDIVMGTWLTNSARYAGKYAPSGPVSALAAGAAFYGGGAEAAAAVAIPAAIAKYLGTYLTRRQIRQLENTIKGESPLGRPIAAQNAAQAPNFAAIAPAAALRSALATSAASPLADAPQ
jgi:predicted NBD/HSP70 family sugar kinase